MIINIIFPQLPQILAVWNSMSGKLDSILSKVNTLQMTVQEAFDVFAGQNVKLDDISAKLTEGFAEITTLIGQLQNTTLTPEQEAIVNNITSKVGAIQPQAQAIADIVPGP